jgi:hypothetical protein
MCDCYLWRKIKHESGMIQINAITLVFRGKIFRLFLLHDNKNKNMKLPTCGLRRIMRYRTAHNTLFMTTHMSE